MTTSGDSRKILLEAIVAMQKGDMDVQTGLAIAEVMKCVNASIQAEVNVVKVQLKAAELGKNFGEVSRLGLAVIGRANE